MQLQVNAPKDLFAGLIFVAFGVSTFFASHQYEIGTPLEMGPGFFPAAIAVVLIAVGVGAIVRGLVRKTEDPITPYKIEPLVLVFAGILAFSFLIERAGLLIASAVLIGIACFPRLRTKPLEVLIVYLVLTAFSALVFVYWFGMQMPLWPGQ
jgi:putative tricarboxylic transport membrane protein